MRYDGSSIELETANRLRRTVAQSARLPAPLPVEAAVAAVMCTFVERLTAGEAHALLAAVPGAVRPMFEMCATHRAGKPTAVEMDRAAFLVRIAEHIDVTPAHAEVIGSAVFTAVRAELPPKLVADIWAQLPHGLKELWVAPPISAPALDVTIPTEEVRHAVEVDIERRAKLPPHVTAAAAFAAVMCTLARRLSGGEARDVVAGLPIDLRPLVERCATHRSERGGVFGREVFLGGVREHLAIELPDAERIVREVFRAAKRVLPQQTIANVASQLPSELRALWQGA